MTHRFLIIAGFADSLVLFRGALIAELVANGLEVHAAAPGISTNQSMRMKLERMGVVCHDIPARRAGTNPVADLWLLWRLVKLMRDLKPDVVLGYTIKPVIYGSIAAWLTRVPRRFAMITGLGFAFTNGRSGRLQSLIRQMYTFALKRTDKVFFQNPDDHALFRELGIVQPSLPVAVVNGSGVDVQQFVQEPLPNKEVRFLMICRLLGDKGVREYAAAARLVQATYPAARFCLAGWIDENPDSIVQSELDGWIANGAIEYIGRLDDVRPAIASCTVYVLPSYREGTPRTVLEAMSMGRPVITTDAPGCRETVVDGRNGFLVPVKSVDALVHAMEAFLLDSTLASKMGWESRKIAETKYDVHKVNEIMIREMGLDAMTVGRSGPHD
ncbi:glycosyltransferase family 4 protein [Fulvimonas sp. R45]|uniref:glycosyltransferase family 4 protein n=1 Tax=Fulvimonas sp. R45 TaxID=3045937 RepID=UPI00266005FC|nr:glycosyltransferase family 4 protein [Fulvimonas sp. R45]MDO1528149.1 glycosyltransferase family 4 protein [Fulvimonas sp. R45]